MVKNKYLAAKEAAKIAEKEKPVGNMRRIKITRSVKREFEESIPIVKNEVDDDSSLSETDPDYPYIEYR